MKLPVQACILKIIYFFTAELPSSAQRIISVTFPFFISCYGRASGVFGKGITLSHAPVKASEVSLDEAVRCHSQPFFLGQPAVTLDGIAVSLKSVAGACV